MVSQVKIEMYASIGFGKTSTEQVIKKLSENISQKMLIKSKDKKVEENIDKSNKDKAKTSYGSEVKVSDFDEDIEVKNLLNAVIQFQGIR